MEEERREEGKEMGEGGRRVRGRRGERERASNRRAVGRSEGWRGSGVVMTSTQHSVPLPLVSLSG